MPKKTRRAGRRIQLQKIYERYAYSPATDGYLLGVDRIPEENLAPTCHVKESGYKGRYRLIPIELKEVQHVPSDIPAADPRFLKYIQRKSQAAASPRLQVST